MNRREKTRSPTPRFRRKIWGPKFSAIELGEEIGPHAVSNDLDGAEERRRQCNFASENPICQPDLHSFFGMLPDDATQDDSDGIFSDSDNSNDINNSEKSGKVPLAREQVLQFSKSNKITLKKNEETTLSEAMPGAGPIVFPARVTLAARSRSASIQKKRNDRTSAENEREVIKSAGGRIPTKRGASQPPSSKAGQAIRGLAKFEASVGSDVEEERVLTISRSLSVPRRLPPKITRFSSAIQYPTSPFSAFNVVSRKDSSVETDPPTTIHSIALSSPQNYESLTPLSQCSAPDSPIRDLTQLNWQSSSGASPSNCPTSPSSRDVTDCHAASSPNSISTNSSCDIPDLDISKPSKLVSPGRSIDTSVTSANSITSIDESSQDESNDSDNRLAIEVEHLSSEDFIPHTNQRQQTQVMTTIDMLSNIGDTVTEKENHRIQTGGASTPRTALLEKCGWTHHHRFARHRSNANANPTSPKIVRLNHVSSAVIVDAHYEKKLNISKENVGIQTGSSLDELDSNYDLFADSSANDNDVTNTFCGELYEVMAAELADLRAWKKNALVKTEHYADEVETLKSKLQALTNQCSEQQKSLSEKETEVSTLESKLREQSSSSNEQHSELEVKTQEIQDLKQRLVLLNAAKYDAEAEAKTLVLERKIIEDDMKVRDLYVLHLQESNEKSKKEAESLMKDATVLRAKVEELQDAQDHAKSLEATLKENFEENKSLKERVQELEVDLDKRRSESWSYEAKISALQDRVHEGLVKINSLCEELQNLEIVNKNLHKKLEDKTNESTALEQSAMSLRTSQDELSAKVTGLITENKSLRCVVSTLEKDLDDAKKSYEENQLQYKNLEKNVSSLRSERDEMAAKVTDLLMDNGRVHGVVAKLEEDLSKNKRSADKALNECQHVQSSATSLTSERDDMSAKATRLVAINEGMQSIKADLEKELEHTKLSLEKYRNENRCLESSLMSSNSERDEMSGEIQYLLKENEYIRGTVDKLNMGLDESKKSFEENILECQYLESVVQSLKSERDEMAIKIADLLRENDRMRNVVGSLNEELDRARKLFEESQSEPNELSCKMEELAAKNDQAQVNVQALEVLLDEAKKSSSDNEALVASLKAERDKMASEVTELLVQKDELLANVASLNKELDVTKMLLDVSRQSHDTMLTSMASERDELSCKMKELAAENDQAQVNVQTLEVLLDEAKKSSSDNEAWAASLKSERDKMSIVTNELVAENKQIKSMIKILEKDLDEAKRLPHESTTKFQSCEDVVVSLKSELDDLTSKIDQLVSENERVRDDLTSTITKKDEEISLWCSKIALIEDEAIEKTKTLELKTAALEELKVQLSESQAILHEKEEISSSMKLELDKTSTKALALLSEVNELRSWKSVAEETIAQQDNELSTLRSDVAKKALLESTVEKLANEVANKESQVRCVLDDLSGKKKSIASLQAELQDAVSRREQLLQEVIDLNDWKEFARKNIDELQSERNLNVSEIDRLSQELIHQKIEVDELQSSIVNLEINVAEKISIISELTGTLQSKEDEIVSLRSKVDSYEEKEVAVSQEINQLHEQYTTANEIISDLEAKLREECNNVIKAQQELEKSNQSCFGLEDEITMLMDEIQVLHESIHTEKANFDNIMQLKKSELEILRAENLGLQECINRLNDDMENMKTAHQSQLKERHYVRRELEAAISEKEDKISSLNEDLRKATEQVHEMQSKALSMSLINEPLSSEISKLRELKWAADKKIEKQEKVIEELKKQVSNLALQCEEQSKCIADKQVKLLEMEQKFSAETLSKAETVSRFEDELLQKSKLIDKLNTDQKHAISHFEETLGKMTDKLTEKEEECQKLRNEFERSEENIDELVAQLSKLNEEKLSMTQNALDMATEFEEKIFVLQLSAERAQILESDLLRQRTKYEHARKALEAMEKTLMASFPQLFMDCVAFLFFLSLSFFHRFAIIDC
ncbi:hypothetical protein ACHAXS_012623 [Conticribra weissflogii]